MQVAFTFIVEKETIMVPKKISLIVNLLPQIMGILVYEYLANFRLNYFLKTNIYMTLKDKNCFHKVIYKIFK